MNYKMLAQVFGLIMLAAGVLGFVPGITEGHMLLGIFHVNEAHNVVHIVTGIAALACASAGLAASRKFFQVFGVVYGLVAIFGFVVGDGLIFGLISNNAADTWLHVGIAAGALAIGFAPRQTGARAMG